jgi:hypothetical protein
MLYHHGANLIHEMKIGMSEGVNSTRRNEILKMLDREFLDAWILTEGHSFLYCCLAVI